jgi:LacI family transcriptional regulator
VTESTKASTMKDVAKRAGVSVKTVSRVMNLDPSVKSSTRDAVLAAARELGYRPNVPARTLVTGRSKIIGLVISDIGNYFFAQFVNGVESAAEARGYSVLLCDTGENPDTELRCVDMLLGHRVDGLILAASRLRDDEITHIADTVRVAIVNRFHPDPRVLTGSIQDEAVRLAPAHLVSLGHRAIGYIGGPIYSRAAWAREKGCRDVLSENGIEGPLVASGFPVNIEGGYWAMNWLLDVMPHITGVVCYNDMLAIGAIRAAEARGRHVPERISIVGFDDIHFAAHAHPPLTTVSVPIHRLGYNTAQLLLDALEANDDKDKLVDAERTRCTVECHLVIRGSAGPVPE